MDVDYNIYICVCVGKSDVGKRVFLVLKMRLICESGYKWFVLGRVWADVWNMYPGSDGIGGKRGAFYAHNLIHFEIFCKYLYLDQ